METLETIEKPSKKIYQKHKVKKTLGIVSYLNKRLKGRIVGGVERYPAYWQITYNGTNTQMKSESFGQFGLTDNEFNADNLVKQKLEREKQKIESSFWKIIEYFEKEHNKSPKVAEIIENYNTIYREPLGETVNRYLGLFLSLGITHNEIYDFCKKNNKPYTLDIEQMEDGVTFDSFGPLSSLEGSPEIFLNLISNKYPKIHIFLKTKFPSQIWRFNELISLIENIPNNRVGFNDSHFNYNSTITWYDFETGRLKRYLYDLGVLNGLLKTEDLDYLLNDLAKINYFNFAENSKDYWCQDQMEMELSVYLKNIG